MADFDFKIDGVEEFQKAIKTVERKAPDRILDKLDEEGRAFVKAAKENTPDSGRKHNKKLKTGWVTEPVEKIGKGYQKGIRNKRPHHHLVNNGHRQVTESGKVIGWVNGRFYTEETVAQEESGTNRRLEEWLNELYEELS